MTSSMTIDLVAFAVVLLYAYIGFRYGLTGALINLAGVVAGYIASVVYTKPVAIWLAREAQISPLIALPIAAAGVFLLVTRLFYVLHLIVRRWLERDSGGPSSFLLADRLAGAGYGLVKGGVLIGLTLWALPVVAGGSSAATSMGLDRSHLVPLVQTTVAAVGRMGFGFVFDDGNAREVCAQAIADPRTAVRAATRLLANPKLRTTISDVNVQRSFAEKGLKGALATDACGALLADPEIQAGLRDLGIRSSDGGRIGQEEVYRLCMDVQTRAQQGAEKVQNAVGTPDLARFVTEPEVVERLKKGELMTVLADPRLSKALGFTVQGHALPSDQPASPVPQIAPRSSASGD